MTEHKTETKEDLARTLARHVTTTRYEDLPEETVATTRKSVLDAIGVIEAASGTTPSINGLVKLVKEAGGKEESTILGFGGKVPAWMAAFVNGAMAHCLDYEDIHHEAGGHPSAGTVPSGLATAERVGNVTGKEFLTAIALGNDLVCRMSYAVARNPIWHKPATLGSFAAAATAGKLLGLNEEQMVDALGLAFCQAAGTMQLRWGTGSNIGGMRDAFPNKAGVLSALMAQNGVSGIKDSLESKGGLYNVYFGGRYDRARATNGLGKEFKGSQVGFKPWPACGSTHVYIDATLALAAENNIKPEQVESIKVYVGEHAQGLCEPIEVRRRPTTTLDAKYSIPFTVALALVNRKVVIEDFMPNRLDNGPVLKLAAKVTPVYDNNFNSDKGLRPGRAPGKVDIKLSGGQVLSKRVDFPYGHPDRPIAWDDLVAKFRDCLSYAARPVPKANVEQVIDLISHLEKVDNVSVIPRLLVS